MAEVNRMLKQQLKRNNHRSRHIHNLKQALQRKAKRRDIKLKKTAKVRNSQVAHSITSNLLKYFNKYKK